MNNIKNTLQISQGKNDCYLICDFGSPQVLSYKKSLEYLKSQPWSSDISVILGFDVPQSQSVNGFYIAIGKILRRMNLKHVLCFGEDIESYRFAFPKMSLLYNKVEDALGDLSKFDFQNETILIKATESMQAQSILALMQQRVHDTIFKIDLNAIAHNLRYMQSKLLPTTRTMCMVKAKSYGLGDVEIATLLQSKGVDYLGVAYVDEGVLLRGKGIRLPMIVMNPERSSLNTLIKYRLEPEIYSLRTLELFLGELKAFDFDNSNPYPIHIKLDTGMHRLGFSASELKGLLVEIKKHQNIRVNSIFSHLVASEDPNEEAFTMEQIDRFEQMSSYLVEGLSYHPIRHILNTTGIVRYNNYQYDMVRVGLGLYGYSPFDDEQGNLQNCATLSTVISQIRSLQVGETVSYNRRYKVKHISRIATLPIGYADGIKRLWGNGNGYVQINDMKASIVGSICMDMMMVDVTNIECKEGDKVVLIGDFPTANEIATACSTIPYEVLTNISDRVKRIYTLDI